MTAPGAWATAQAHIAELAAINVAATTDPTSVPVPGVLFEPPKLTFDLYDGYSARMSCLVMTEAPFNDRAWQVLEHLITTIAPVLDVEDGEPVSVEISGRQLVAYRLTWEESV